MAVSFTLERKLSYKEHCKHSAYGKTITSLKGVQYKAIGVETKDVRNIAYSFIAKGKGKNVNFSSNVPFSRLGTEKLSFSRAKLPWLIITRHWNRQNPHDDLDKLCNTIVSAIHESGAECGIVKCTQFRKQKESYSYPLKKVDNTGYYDFSIEYHNLGIFHYYTFRTSTCPHDVDEIANVRYLIQLDSLALPVRTDKVTAPSIILAPNTLDEPLYYLLWNKGNYQKKRNQKYFDEKLTISSNPYHPCHARTEKLVDGKIARAVTLVKNGVLLHLPLNREDSKKVEQKYIPNTYNGLELSGGSTPLTTIVKESGNALFIYDLRGEIGDDGSFSGIIKNGFLLKDGVFTERLLNAPIFFNVCDIYNHIEVLSSELVSQGHLLVPYIKFNKITKMDRH